MLNSHPWLLVVGCYVDDFEPPPPLHLLSGCRLSKHDTLFISNLADTVKEQSGTFTTSTFPHYEEPCSDVEPVGYHFITLTHVVWRSEEFEESWDIMGEQNRFERAHLHTYSFLKPYFGIKSANLIRSYQDWLVIMYMQVWWITGHWNLTTFR